MQIFNSLRTAMHSIGKVADDVARTIGDDVATTARRARRGHSWVNAPGSRYVSNAPSGASHSGLDLNPRLDELGNAARQLDGGGFDARHGLDELGNVPRSGGFDIGFGGDGFPGLQL